MAGRFKERKLLHFGLDYVKAYISKINEDRTPKILSLGLSVNSHIFFYNDNYYIEYKENVSRFDYYFELKDRETNLTLCFLMINKFQKRQGSVIFNDTFEITGTGFIMTNYNLKVYLAFLKFCGYKIDKFNRVDVCFDLEADVDYLYKRVFKDTIAGKTQTPFIKRGRVETFYLGEKNKLKNTYQLIRVYDKNQDSKAKSKQFMYPEYAGKEVARLEVEIRRDKAKFLTIDNLLDDNYIFGIIVKTFYPFNYQYFKFLHLEDFKRCKVFENNLYQERLFKIQTRYSNFIKYGKDFIDEKEETKTLQTFVTYGKKLFNNGYDLYKLFEVLETQLNEESLPDNGYEEYKIMKRMGDNPTI